MLLLSPTAVLQTMLYTFVKLLIQSSEPTKLSTPKQNGHNPGTPFCQRLAGSQGHSVVRITKSLKNSPQWKSKPKAFQHVVQCLNQMSNCVLSAYNY